MYESSARTYPRMTYTLDLSGLVAHARDTIEARLASGTARTASRDRLPRARVGPIMHSHAESCALRTNSVR
jgi:hypothetical protein